MKSLVLAEKPSVAKEIARVLGCGQQHRSYLEGPNYVVTWALGHLVTLSEPEDYDPKYRTWNLEELPILPDRMKLKVMKETSGQFRAVAQLCKRSDLGELIIATDAGREGELVARWIMELVGWRKPFKRLWISSQTDQAIRDGFRSLKPGRQYDALYRSAVCRAEADWLIGLNVTRALTTKYDAQLAAGRVQTPTLSILIEREREIREFQPKPYWTISADFGSFQAQWREKDGHDGRVWDEAQARAVAERVSGGTAKVAKLNTVEKSEPFPQAYDLTELQRDANKKLGFSAKTTSNVLQKLYEQHKLVTYPRTDSRYISSDIVPTLKGRLDSIAIGPYATLARKLLRGSLPVSKRFVDDNKVSDHHAIIPTDQYVNLSALSNDERRLYDLIVRRFIALFYPPYRYDETSVVLSVGSDHFHAKGRIEKDAGWREVYASGNSNQGAEDWDDASEEGAERADAQPSQRLPELAAGQSLPVKACRAKELRTQPPARYTEAALLARMEKHGLGTPATRADIIEKLLSTDTIDRSQNRLAPTGKGTQLYELVVDDLRSPDMTAQWESELERIAKGSGNPDKFMAGIRERARLWVDEIKRQNREYKPHNLTAYRCPECGKPLKEVKSKRGKSYVCSDRECEYRRSAEPNLTNHRCPQCHKKMELRDGKAGKFFHCRPCNVIEKLGDKTSGGRAGKHEQRKLIEKFGSDSAPASNSLGEALLAAMKKKDE
ncbi:DNA topoisomerase III [Cohnella thailandensis]|uniref:DNA topoisomerase n=1 Tax=Cohnella thailandensis TaxID=557557 RepID=A0A841SNW1_9BACL|nr:DNA topoisomerase 3 [Cohnella thailandensis]MBB6633634.1 DNA topoisomerase III [Cohnella thailandensis]MBP1976419.1 DNA topoisomerase-3 [Cohnella thailandensis]